jgi:hypothetical protein
MSPATRNSWKTLPLPDRRELLGLSAVFSDADGERMIQGHVPRDMDDEWFIFFDNGWLYFHRSWTGTCIYAQRLDGSPAGVRVIDGWVSRDAEEYRSPGIERDREIVLQLIRSRLLT